MKNEHKTVCVVVVQAAPVPFDKARSVDRACEGRCFVLGCNQFVTRDMYPKELADAAEAELPEVMCRGGSVIVSPFGGIVAGPLYDEEGILFAELDPAEIVRAKVDFDVVGHYARPDIFQLSVNREPQPPVSFRGLSGRS